MNLFRWLVPLSVCAGLYGQNPQARDPKLYANLEWRFIGPAIMGGRATDVEGVPGDPAAVYIGYASGGLWKTANGGMTWTPLMEKLGVYSVGDFALQPANPGVIWLGTGESNTRNSVSFGDGVYRSTDCGKTRQHMGLGQTERISRVLVHPANPDVVYVGALGHAFGPHPDRGVYMTTDAGKSWTKTLYLDDQHGVADLEIDPANPNILFAALWKFERKPWTHTSGSEKGGVFRSTDGGRTWTKLEKGLPKLMGRIGVKVAPSNPRAVYVIAESKEGTLYRSDDGGDSFRQVSKDREIVSRGFYYADLRVDPLNENKVYAIASTLYVSIDGGKEFKSIVNETHIDYHSLWIDPNDPRRMWNANDGGIAVSQDGGATWQAVYNIAAGQFYQVHADNREPFYWVMGGLQDNGSWAGPSRTREPSGILNDDWRMVQFGDGFHMLNHPDTPDLYLSESQGGNVGRTDMRTREQQDVSVVAVSTAGGPASEARYRFNWNTPLVPSPHDKNTVYMGGNVLFRSRDFGQTWEAISPDLTTNDKEKQKTAGGPVWYDNSTAEYHCTIASVAESPARAGHLWAGTDDGRLHRSTDGGKSWTELTRNVAGLPPFSPVSHIEPSRRTPAAAYASFDRHMLDDFRPYVYRTTDGGKTWMNIAGKLPAKAYVHVVREDPKNAGLIYVGTETGLFLIDPDGNGAMPLGLKNLPPVAVHDIQVHARENDIILGTHGRSIVILDDIAALQTMTEAVAASDVHLFEPRPAMRYRMRFTRYGMGGSVFKGANPPYGALLTYYLKNKLDDKAALKIEVYDAKGEKVRQLEKLPREAGLQRVAWDLRGEPAALRKPPTENELAFGGGPRGVDVLPGLYTVKLTAGERTVEAKLEVRLDPSLGVSGADLGSRHEMGKKLRDMLDEGNKVVKVLDNLKEQMDQAEKTAKTLLPEDGKAVSELLDAYRKELAKALEKLARPPDSSRLEEGPLVMEKLAELYANVEGVNAAPTKYQREAFEELAPDFRTRVNEAREFLRKIVPAWNTALRKAVAAELVTGKI